jgi:hypothetical protein
MDYREDSFRRKFAVASQILGVPPEQIVSLKLREDVSSYGDYRQLVDSLHHDAGLEWSEIQADLQGRGYLLGDGNVRVIVVEHETGLELLYIAGSIASLIALVPLVLDGWHALRGQYSGRRGVPDRGMEIRRIDDAGCIHEEPVHERFPGPFLAMESALPALATTAGLIEAELRTLNDQIQRLNARVEALEQQRQSSSAPGPKPHSPPEASKRRTATRKETKP